MSSKKRMERELYGPGWGEVIFGAVLCVALGVLLAMVYLAFKPVAVVASLKDPKILPGQVTFIEGSKDSGRGQAWTRTKRAAFLAGQAVDLNEEELNSEVAFALMLRAKAASLAKAEPAKPEKVEDPNVLRPKKKEEAKPAAPAPGEAAPDAPLLDPGLVNFRIADNAVQISMPVGIPQIEQTVIIQATGVFARSSGGSFTFVPSKFYVGSLPLHLVPGASEELVKRAFASEYIPADIRTAWEKLSEVRIEGRTLKLDPR